MTAEYLSEVSKNTPSLLKLAVLVLLVVGCTAYPTSFDSIEVVTKQGDTVIEGVISPDGLLFASPNKNATDIYLWKQATGRFEFSSSLTGHLGEVQTVDINSDHTIIVSGSVDQTAIVWRYNETSGGYDSSQTLTDVQSYIPIVQISGNGSVIVVGGGLQDVYVYLLDGDQYVSFQTLPNTGPVQAVAIDANSGAIAYSAVGDAGPTQLYAFNPENRQYELRQSLTSEVYSADWSSTGANLFLGHGKVLEIYVYSDADDSYKLLSKLDDALDNILSVDVSGAGDEWLASASVDGNVYIYRLVGKQYKYFSKLSFSGEKATHVSFSDDANFLTATFESKAFIYQYGIDCSGDPHSTTKRSSNVSCECKVHFMWDAPSSQCVVDCSKDPHNNGTIGPFRCWCNDGYLWNVDFFECMYDCSVDPNSKHVNDGPEACLCNDGFAWNTGNMLCYFDCSVIKRSTHKNVNASACECITKYIWKDQDCYFDCTADPNSNGTNIDLNVDACYCKKGYRWNTTQMKCEGYVDCTKDPHSTGDNINATTCDCKVGFRWNPTIMLCEFNCAQDPNSNGTNADVESCYCRGQFVWNSDLSRCSIVCSNDTHSNGTNRDSSSCYCNINYIWSPYRTECVYWFECKNDPNSNGINIKDDACECRTNYIWQDINHACTIMCSNDPNSNGKPAGVDSCFCNSGYDWDTSAKMCKSAAADQTTIVIVLAIVTGLLALLCIYLIFRIIKNKRRNNPSLIMSADVNQPLHDDDA